MKSICVVASRNADINGDVILIKELADNFDCIINFTQGVSTDRNKSNTEIHFRRPKNIKLSLLWFWHLVFLGKPYIYLTKAI